ncbi:AP-4 complex accessory subunit Tepsin [Seminavis robusta]|uniref:AP-4 complex accessory subunit Tepsin n=1 Tax=Seminavis robusta TaxID=568900 RepID=A0A9N8DA85_9STRA|nr:AP-4 complex accessory subunit Tepsin [Seminavis robusta]|eukprot:Sro49_g028730.1 AP-4 complex accessory subunit Tepsin (768) ;mRNA; f:103268-105827
MDRQLLNRATDGSDAPTPGYLYIDIAKNAASSPMACQEIATFLTRKLANKQNANIKWKCLKVIAKTAEAVSRGQFKRAVAQDQSAVAAIRLATNFRGPPDPVRGDEPYNRVRLAAKECLDMIYSETPTQADQSPYNSGGGGMSNTYGAPPHQQNAYSGGGAGAGAGGMPPPGRRMEGIGNPMFSDPRLEPQSNSVESVIKDIGESFVGMIKDPLARNADVRTSNSHGEMPRPGGMQGFGSHNAGTYGRPPPGRSELAHATGGQWTMASNRGPNAVGGGGSSNSNDAYYKSREQGNNAFSWANKDAHGSQGGVGGSWASPAPSQASRPSYADQHSTTPSITINSAPSAPINRGSGGTAVSDGSYEKNLVIELCPPGGMKPVPPPDKLLNFAKAIPNLNPDLICPVLLDCLEDGHPWIMRAKALCVMETCIQAGARPDNTNPYANFFYTCRGEVEPLANHARAAVKDPARRVLALLGVELSEPAAAAPPPAAAPPVPPAPAAPVNLLDFDDTPAAAVPAPPPSAPPPPPSQPAAATGGGNMFGGMELKSAPAAAPVAPPPAPTSGFLLDGLTVNNPPAPAPAAPAKAPEVIDMFGSLSVKANDVEEEKKKGSEDTDDLAAVAASGSAFGFINSDSSQAPAVAAAPAAQPNTVESFDPLSAFSPNTQRQMMQLSPEQMQAMAYQQMLMQQQAMQMQQMQMAMAMQGGGGGMPRVGGAPMSMMPGVGPGVMGPHAGRTSSGFSFLDNPAAKKEDKMFDFVQDAMKTEKTHK